MAVDTPHPPGSPALWHRASPGGAREGSTGENPSWSLCSEPWRSRSPGAPQPQTVGPVGTPRSLTRRWDTPRAHREPQRQSHLSSGSRVTCSLWWARRAGEWWPRSTSRVNLKGPAGNLSYSWLHTRRKARWQDCQMTSNPHTHRHINVTVFRCP